MGQRSEPHQPSPPAPLRCAGEAKNCGARCSIPTLLFSTPPRMPTLKTVTLGCKVNQYETEYVRQGLAQVGYRDARDDESPELCIVNTCTRDGRRRGQVPQDHPPLGPAASPDGHHRDGLLRHAGRRPKWRRCRAFSKSSPTSGCCPICWPAMVSATCPRAFPRSPAGGGPTSRCRTVAGCTAPFCIIPRVRPVLSQPRGRRRAGRDPPADRQRTSRNRAHRHPPGALRPGPAGPAGDPPRVRLAGLLAQIVRLPGEFRVRLSSLEAIEARGELIAVMRDNRQRVCPHLHLSMQSGSDAVLAPNAAALAVVAVHRALPGSPGRLGEPGPDHRRDRGLSRRNGGRLPGDLPGVRGCRFREDPHLPLQPPPGNPRRRDARPGARSDQAAAGDASGTTGAASAAAVSR